MSLYYLTPNYFKINFKVKIEPKTGNLKNLEETLKF